MLLILFACFAPKSLSDDEEILVDGPVLDSADTGIATEFDTGVGVGDSAGTSTPRDHVRARVEGWLTAALDVDANAMAGGSLQVRRTPSGLSCLHTGLVLPCGVASVGMLTVDAGVITVPYAIAVTGTDSGSGIDMCAWTMAYSLEGLGADAGGVDVTYANSGALLATAAFEPATAEGAR